MEDETKTEDTQEAQPSEAVTRVRQDAYAVALHAQCLIVFVSEMRADLEGNFCPNDSGWSGEWAAYCVPVKGVNHELEKHEWEQVGCRVSERLARVVNGAFCEHMDELGLPYRD